MATQKRPEYVCSSQRNRVTIENGTKTPRNDVASFDGIKKTKCVRTGATESTSKDSSEGSSGVGGTKVSVGLGCL